MSEKESLKRLRIFAASPSDVAAERAKLGTVVASLKPMADYLGLALEVVDWHDVVPEAGRPQQVIFDQLKPTSWDIFVGILWHRFGTPPGAKDKTGEEYLSGTEEEFKTAYELWKRHQRPRIVLYRCTRALPYDVDPDQLKRVREFFKLVEDVKGDYPTLYQPFDTAEAFERIALNHLQKLLIEYGEQSKSPITPEVAQVLAPKIPNNLPRRAAFFGRAKEMEVVMRALSPVDRTWGVLVDGIGGIGKTALAVEAGYRARDAGSFNAFVFITAKQNILEPSGIRAQTPAARTLGDFLNETTRVLGQPGIAKLTGDEKRHALLDALRTLSTLLIYDNFETLSKEEQEGMADFLRELPQNCKAIITSRRRGGEGAVWLRVEKLDWDAARDIIENEMTRDAGLANKLRRFEPRWQELQDETNGSPLALVHTLGLIRVRAALTFDGALEMLRGNRDANLQIFIFQEARKELTTNDKTALGALSFFVPSATFEAWMQVAKLSRGALETTIDRLSALSLVDVHAGEERYALHPLTRDFVRVELLADANVALETGMRFARFWVDYAARYGGSKSNYKTFVRLEEEWKNMEMAGTWLWDSHEMGSDKAKNTTVARMLSELASVLRQFLLFSGRWDERVRLNMRGYEVEHANEEWNSTGRHAYEIARIFLNRGSFDETALWIDKCAEAWQHIPGKREKGNLMRMRGQLAQSCGDYDKAESLYNKALHLGQNLIVLLDLGRLQFERGKVGAAKRKYRAVLILAQRQGQIELQAQIFGKFGELACVSKDLMEARNRFEQELTLAREVGSIDLIAHAQYGLARVYETEGRADLSLTLAQEALRIYERLQHKDLAEVRELVKRLSKNVGA